MNFLDIIKMNFQNIFNINYLGVSISQLIIFILLLFFAILINGLFARFIVSRLKSFVNKTKNKIDDKLFDSLIPPFKFLPIVFVFLILTLTIDSTKILSLYLQKINGTLLTIFIFWFLHQSLITFSIFFSKLESLLSKALVSWMVNSIKYLIIFLGVVAILETWGIKIGPVIAGLGLLGVAVALGAQDLFKNLISGILVLVEKRFKVGDWILVENIIEGVVEKIGFRSTVVRKFDKSVAVIPNFQFAENAVINISETTNWRINWIITLQYDTTVDQLKKIRDEIDKYITTSKDYKISENTTHAVRIDKFSDSSIDMYVRCFTNTDRWSEWLKVKERLAIAIKEIVERNKASFAFPSQSIYVEKK